MKTINPNFIKNTFQYNLIKRINDFALYELTKNSITNFEVHIVKISPASTGKFKNPDGTYQEVKFEEKEILSSAENFGVFGFSFQKRNNAMNFFNKLVSGQNPAEIQI